MTAPSHPSQRAFTLIEVLIVLAIIVMVSGLAAVALLGRRDEADRKATQIALYTLGDAMDAFRLDYRRYPTDDEGVAVLWDKSKLDSEADGSLWAPYLTKPMPRDVWGSAWGYAQEADGFDEGAEENPVTVAPYDLWSYGPDKEDGTDDDIRVGASASEDEESELGGGLVPDNGP